jgi:hypothetical protein
MRGVHTVLREGQTALEGARTTAEGGTHDTSLCQFQGVTVWVESTSPKVS